MNKPLICSLIALSAVLFSCKKSDKSKLVGTWKITEYAGDDNGNKIMDAAEIKPMAANADHRYTFKSDGTVHMEFIDMGICGTLSDGEWELKSNNKLLEMSIDGYKTSLDILTLDGKELKTRSEHQTGYVSWMTLEKQ